MLAGQKRPRPDSLADVEPGPAAVDDASDPGHAAMGSVPFGSTESLLRQHVESRIALHCPGVQELLRSWLQVTAAEQVAWPDPTSVYGRLFSQQTPLTGFAFEPECLNQALLDAVVIALAWPRARIGPDVTPWCPLTSLLAARADPNCACAEQPGASCIGPLPWLCLVPAGRGGATPLHRLALAREERPQEGKVCAVAALLLRSGADPNRRDTEGGGMTPLHWACHSGMLARRPPRPPLIELLLAGRADAGARTAQGYGALQLSLPHAAEAGLALLSSATGALDPAALTEAAALARHYLRPGCAFTGEGAADDASLLRAQPTPKLQLQRLEAQLSAAIAASELCLSQRIFR